jgi:hypothetical protein
LEDEEGSVADEYDKDFGILSDYGSVFEIGDSLYRQAESREVEEQIIDIVGP